MRGAHLVTAAIILGGSCGYPMEGDDVREQTVSVAEGLVAGAGEATSAGRAISAAQARQLMAEAAAAPAPEEPDPVELLSEIPRLTGRARVAGLNAYISYAHDLPVADRAAALARLAALWQRSGDGVPDPSPAPPDPPPPGPPPPPSAITSCTIGFGQSTALGNLPDDQAYGFALPPWYKHHCSSLGWNFKVDDSGGATAGHIHIWSDDPAVDCFTTNSAWPGGVMGKTNGGTTCSAINPLNESRAVATHGAAYWVRIRNVTSTALGWRAAKIKVLGPKEVRVMLDNTDGTWWEYTHLTSGTWTLLPNGHKAETAWIMDQNPNAGSPPAFDNFTIQGPL